MRDVGRENSRQLATGNRRAKECPRGRNFSREDRAPRSQPGMSRFYREYSIFAHMFPSIAGNNIVKHR